MKNVEVTLQAFEESEDFSEYVKDQSQETGFWDAILLPCISVNLNAVSDDCSEI